MLRRQSVRSGCSIRLFPNVSGHKTSTITMTCSGGEGDGVCLDGHRCSSSERCFGAKETVQFA